MFQRKALQQGCRTGVDNFTQRAILTDFLLKRKTIEQVATSLSCGLLVLRIFIKYTVLYIIILTWVIV